MVRSRSSNHTGAQPGSYPPASSAASRRYIMQQPIPPSTSAGRSQVGQSPSRLRSTRWW